ncbi:MAG: aminotransferase class V-fold PLP-dependent enzyme [Acidimicrobiales bacterium]
MELPCDPKDLVVGARELVPLADGRFVRYVNLDNAASTPPLVAVADAVADLLPYYASVHRGAGYKSRFCTEAYEVARHRVGSFFGADPDRDVVIFGRNTTDAVNKLAHRLPVSTAGDRAERVVVTTLAEHHSNLLPWRARGPVVQVGLRPDGSIDLDQLGAALRRHAGRIDLVAVSGASNVTGLVPPIHELASWAHAAGAPILVDGAQLAPHRPIDLRPHDDPGHIDYLAISGHKLYAPYGAGALIGPRATFDLGAPEYQGGGTVDTVTADGVIWAPAPDRDEAGSPNVVGAVALGVALKTLAAIGMDRVAAAEHQLMTAAVESLRPISGVRLVEPADPAVDRVGVIPFEVLDDGGDPVDHRLVAARLAHEHGIGVRNGCFCAHPLLATLLDIPPDEIQDWATRRGDGFRPGLLRASLGCYSDVDDVDRLAAALVAIAKEPSPWPYRLGDDGQFSPDTRPGWLPPRLQELLRP